MVNRLSYIASVFIAVLLTFSACNSSKSYLKKGAQLTQAGLQKEAAEFYLMALRKNANNVDARIALKREGQKLLETQLEEFYKLYTAENYIGATQKYREVLAYQELVKPYVQLEVAPYYADYYNESKKYFLEDRYQKASGLINENKFESANQYLKELLDVDPTYKDAANLKNYSDVEPVYLDGIKEYEAGRYKKAYELFSRVLKMNGNYKQADYYREEALAKGRLTIAILDLKLVDNSESVGQALERSILQSGSIKKDPFVVYIDRKHTNEILNEQKLGLSGALDEKSVAETGKLLGAKYLINGKVLEYKHSYEPLSKSSKSGYHETITRRYNKAKGFYYNQKTYSRTYYTQYSVQRTIECRIELSLINTETGEIVLTQVYTEKQSDLLQYVVYPKDPKYLYPTNAQSNAVNKDALAKQQLDKMLAETRREVISEDQLSSELAQKVAKNWVWRIKTYSKEVE